MIHNSVAVGHTGGIMTLMVADLFQKNPTSLQHHARNQWIFSLQWVCPQQMQFLTPCYRTGIYCGGVESQLMPPPRHRLHVHLKMAQILLPSFPHRHWRTSGLLQNRDEPYCVHWMIAWRRRSVGCVWLRKWQTCICAQWCWEGIWESPCWHLPTPPPSPACNWHRQAGRTSGVNMIFKYGGVFASTRCRWIVFHWPITVSTPPPASNIIWCEIIWCLRPPPPHPLPHLWIMQTSFHHHTRHPT